MLRKLISLALVAAFSISAGAQDMPSDRIKNEPIRTGLGQDDSKGMPRLKNLRLSDPLVQQKYMNDPDMMRFLRTTYSEACTRGLLYDAANVVKLDAKKTQTPEARNAAAMLMEGRRLWRMGSFELEVLLGASYLNSANYCDCLMKEVTDVDLVNPKKGLEVIEKISRTAQKSCEANAVELTARQLENQKKARGK